MNTVGRPRKLNATKAGALKEGLCRFSFIADENKIIAIKKMAVMEGVTIKNLMSRLIKIALENYKDKGGIFTNRFLRCTITCKGFNKSRVFRFEDSLSQQKWLKEQRKQFVDHKKLAAKSNYIDWGTLIYHGQEFSK